jgi:hypothetical protein
MRSYVGAFLLEWLRPFNRPDEGLSSPPQPFLDSFWPFLGF